MNKLFAILSLLLVGCANVSVTEPSICDTQGLSQLPIVPNANVPALSFSEQVDLSGPIVKLGYFGDNISLTVTQLSLSGDVSWVRHVEVDMSTVTLPNQVVVSSDVSGDDTLNLPVTLSEDTFYQYLSSGPVTLTFTLVGENVPTQVPTLIGDFCVSASEQQDLN